MFALLIGDHRQGKTTTCRLMAERGRALGWSIGGVLQPAVYQGADCVGYDVVDLASDRSARLAIVGGGGCEHAGRFAFLPEGLEFGKAAIRRALHEKPRIVIIDEVGPLELAGGGWSEQLDELLRNRALEQPVASRAGGRMVEPTAPQPNALSGRVLLWSVRRMLASEIEARWCKHGSTEASTALFRYDLLVGADAIVGDILMAQQRGLT